MKSSTFVMPGLVAGITSSSETARKGADGRDKPGHDETNRQLDGL
ncbi:hypothetical protein [Rhodopseudomonas palustris]|nr:hypothetical protein [Rhodopseudomonas palustris]